MNFSRDSTLSKAALDLVQFDADSINQVASSQHFSKPDTWLADPDSYEKNGRVLRDSESSRMLAYSKKDHVLYATDGCNSCARRLRTDLQRLPLDELQQFAADNELRLELLQNLVDLL